MNKINLCGLTAEGIFDLIRPGGFEFRHALSVANIIYKRGGDNPAKISKLPGRLWAFLKDAAQTGIHGPSASQVSVDRTVKLLFRSSGGKQFETVYIPDGRRNTVCVSTQSGCRRGCPFCVSGKYGFHGNLSAGEIVNQVLSITFGDRISHIVFMGMGEPMDNLENVLKACRIMTAEWGMAVSPRNITISSVGVTPAIKEFLERSACNLTISLYSPFAGERIRIIPAEKEYPVREIIGIMMEYPLHKKRRFSVAYIMIDMINDTDMHLGELIRMLKNTGIRVNLIPYNPDKGDLNRSSPDERMLTFKHNLILSGISASVRKSRGADIFAACGLLASGLGV